MIDREKVIKGLECFVEPDNGAKTRAECRKRECPYIGTDCEITVMRDALELLKEQEARVLTLEEVKASKGADMYLEISAQTDAIPYITAATLDGTGTKGVSFYCSQFDFVAYNRRLYGWRCWTSRPTDEQREATPWLQTGNT